MFYFYRRRHSGYAKLIRERRSEMEYEIKKFNFVSPYKNKKAIERPLFRDEKDFIP